MTAAQPIEHPVESQRNVPPDRIFYSKFESMRRMHVELSTIVVVAMGIVTVSCIIGSYCVIRSALARPPLVVGVDSATGAAYALRPDSLKLQVTELMLRNPLEKWTRDHFERIGVEETAYRKSLQVMGSHLVSAAAVNDDLTEIDRVRRGELDPLEIRILTSVIEDASCADKLYEVSSALCSGLVTFEKVRGKETVSAVATVQFARAEKALSVANPLGFVVTGFHVEEGRRQ